MILMKTQNELLAELKNLLEKATNPAALNSHPWQQALFVQQAVAENPDLASLPKGRQLLHALALIFKKLQPTAPPRRGKRLDTHWGEFGLLAAHYFAPVLHGQPGPRSLRDAWQKIDHAILLFVFGSADDVPGEERDCYKLVGDEPEVASNSTISDWHRKGLQYLAEAVYSHELHLSDKTGQGSPLIGNPAGNPNPFLAAAPKNQSGWTRFILPAVLLVVLVVFAWLGGKAWTIYQLGLSIQDGLRQAQQVDISFEDPASLKEVGPILGRLREDLDALDAEMTPFYPFLPALGWVPQYGAEIQSAQALIATARNFAAAGDDFYRGARPVLDLMLEDGENRLTPEALTGELVKGLPRFESARVSLDAAMAARQQIDEQKLSPQVRRLVQQRLDPYLVLFDDAVNLAILAPRLLGAGGAGPQTYLLLLQNEDEIRPTGGFLTAAGSVVVQNGKLLTMNIESSDTLEDLSKFHPDSSWSLKEYFDIHILVLRDANWYIDFPVAAGQIERLYALTRASSVNGMVAIDQRFLVELLKVTGPVRIPGSSVQVDSENVIEYMRKSKVPPSPALADEWNRKAFLSVLAPAVVEKLLSGGYSPQQLFSFVRWSLEERHLILQFDDPTLADFLHRYNWDGSVQVGDDDFVMVVDSNSGYNKSNAVVDMRLAYSVDLADIKAPQATLVVNHQNKAPAIDNCSWSERRQLENQPLYVINDCYWNYLRVVVPAGVELTGYQAQEVPDELLRIDRDIPARIDLLPDEAVPNATVFGTFMVVPAGQENETRIDYTLPSWVMTRRGEEQIYRLAFKKQPGTNAIPLQVSISLPPGATLVSASDGFEQDGDVITFNRRLNRDQFFEVIFLLP